MTAQIDIGAIGRLLCPAHILVQSARITGKFAAQTLLNDTTPITRMRGKWQSYHGIKLMPTLHPAYLLRNPKDKRLVWEDIKAVLREIGRL